MSTREYIADDVEAKLSDIHVIHPLPMEELASTEASQTEDESSPVEDYPESIDIELSDIRASALANNLELKVQLYSPSIAEEFTNIENAKFESVFRGVLNYNKTNSPTSSGLEGTQTESYRTNIGIDQPLSTGGVLSVELPTSRVDTNNPFSLLNPAYQTDLQFSISQPLLRNAWRETNTHSIRLAEFQEQIVNTRTKLEAIRVLAGVERAYWLVYAASKELDVRLQQYALAEQQLSEAKSRVRALVSPQVEITRAESGVASRLESIIIARTFLRRQERALKRIMNAPNIPLEASTHLIPQTLPAPVEPQIDTNQIIALAMDSRMELLELELQLAQDNSSIEFEKNNRLPLFSVDYVYNINGLGTGYDRSLDQVFERDFSDWFVGLRFEIPIGNKAANARLRQAVQQRSQRLITREQRQQQIQQEIYDALDQLQQNWERILAAQRDILFAERTYAAERRQFELGVRTSTDVLDAAERLAIAQSREIQAITDYQITLVDVAFATGTTLGQAQMKW